MWRDDEISPENAVKWNWVKVMVGEKEMFLLVYNKELIT